MTPDNRINKMRFRITRLHNVASEILPSFCHGVNCDHSCPLWNDKAKRHDDFCQWLNVKEQIDAMYEKLEAIDGNPIIDADQGQRDQLTTRLSLRRDK